MSLDDEAAAMLREEVEDHIAEIMFDSGGSAERDCVLCLRGIDLGVWAYYGVDDPFEFVDGP